VLLLSASAPAQSGSAAPTAACCSKTLAGEKFSERSLYQLDSIWTTDKGASVKFAELHGRPQVVLMFFSTCVAACPLLVNDLKRIEESLPVNVRTNVGFLLVSFDSERDTPAKLAKYRAQHNLPANWNLLHGEPDDVLELAALLGVKFKKESAGGFAHSNIITLLNPAGEIVTQQIGLNRDPAPLADAAVKSLTKP
jgi:protein SCO1/2